MLYCKRKIVSFERKIAMDTEVRELGGGITLHAVQTSKFKTDSVYINFILPFNRETVTRVSLLRGLLLRGYEGYPSFEKLSARTDELYGADIVIDTSSPVWALRSSVSTTTVFRFVFSSILFVMLNLSTLPKSSRAKGSGYDAPFIPMP